MNGGILKMSAGKSLEKSRLKIPKSYKCRGVVFGWMMSHMSG